MGDGYAYQFAARASSLVFLLVSIRLWPMASRANEVMLMEVLAQVLEVYDCQMIQGSAGPQPSESHSSSQA